MRRVPTQSAPRELRGIGARRGYSAPMKCLDQPDAKLKLWAAQPRPVRIPRIANLPHFGVRRFNSYEAFNRWKQELLLQLVQNGGAKWTH